MNNEYRTLRHKPMNTRVHKHLNTLTSSLRQAQYIAVQRTLALKYFISMLFSLWTFGFSWGQTLEWAHGNIGGISISQNKFVIDKDKNSYNIGSFYLPITFDYHSTDSTMISNGDFDICFYKLDSIGNLIWAKRIGGINQDIAYAIDIDSSSNIYCTGSFEGTVDFDPSSNIYNITSKGNRDIFICKFDSSGIFKWAKGIGSTYNDKGCSLKLDFNQNIIVSGDFKGLVDFDPGINTFYFSSAYLTNRFILKLDSDANFIWAEEYGHFIESSSSKMDLDKNGNIYLVGYFSTSINFISDIDTLTLTSNGVTDIFVAKYDSSGFFKWAKNFGGVAHDYGYGIVVDNNNNIIYTGAFQADSVDFDPSLINEFYLKPIYYTDFFISKLNSNGDFIWAKQLGYTDNNIYTSFSAINLDLNSNIYTTGTFYGLLDFDLSPTKIFYLKSESDSGDIFINKLDSNGNFIWAKRFGGIGKGYGGAIIVDNNFSIYTSGSFNGIVDFNPNSGIMNLTGSGNYNFKLNQKGITGYLFNDFNHNCNRDSLELGIQNYIVKINLGNIIAQTNESGVWVIDSLPIGTYTATLDTSGNWLPTCPVTQTFTVTNPNEITYVPDFGLVSTQPCASPDVSINMPFMRPCFSNQKVYVNACNQYIATGALDSAYVDVEFDSLITPQSASLAYTSLGNNTSRFLLGNLNPGQCKNFTIDCQVSCDAVLGQTLCVEANLYPADSCVFDTIPSPFPGDFTPCTLPWDKSSLSVKGWCQNDSIYFSVCNSGQDMDCFTPVRIYIDGVYTTLDSLQLAAGACFVYSFAGDGRTWRLEADQHPLHPGNSHPNATVEACGDLNNWTPDLVNILPQDDADPVVDIYCGVVTGSYDPNDKAGYPIGLAYNHYIMPNQQLQYVIRFQNTGTDTAFTVVVRDTLDMDLDIFSVVPGVASHTYNFQMYGPRVLEWTFYNIQLPDSNHNEAESHGFCTFTVNQNHDLPNNTKITNSADIYFDYNAPVITNQTIHTVNDQIQTAVVTKVIPQGNKVSEVLIYPNPAKDEVFVESSKLQAPNSKFKGKNEYIVYSVDGKKVLEGKLESPKTRISTKDLESGIYFIELSVGNEKMTSKLVITK